MHPQFSFIIIIFFIAIKAPLSLCDDDQRYTNCTRKFDCGSITNIGFPFWGVNRPEYCGLPEFELFCRDGSPEITIMSESYSVLGINQTHQNLTLSRKNLWNYTCPQRLVNTTLDYKYFDFTEDNENVTMFYQCTSSRVLRVSNQFSCAVNGTISDSFFLTGPVPYDPNLNLTKCNITVVVPVLRTAIDGFVGNSSALGVILKKGFEVKYTAYENLCLQCNNSGGQCGYNWTLLEPTCFCSDGPHSLLCSGSKTDLRKKLIIGFSTGAAGILLTSFLCLLIIRYHNIKRSNFSTYISRSISSKLDQEKGSTYLGLPIFTYRELEKATDNFNASKELGDGGYGSVYQGKLRDGRVVAVKRLYENNYKRLEQFINEVDILTRLRHQNLVTLYGCTSRHSRGLLLVYEYVPNGTVADHLYGDRAKAGSLTWPIRMSIAIETASALAYLHASDIIHRDVKTNNILLDNNFCVKVADFGLSRLLPPDVTHVSTGPQGTPGYLDPEYHQSYQLTEKSDVYSFGVVLIELISSMPAVDINRKRHDINLSSMAINKIQNRLLHELVDPSLWFKEDYTVRRMTEVVAELAFQCLQHEKELRPSMNEVLETLRGIESNKGMEEKAVKVDTLADNAGILKNSPPLLSPDSIADKWVSGSTTTTDSI